MRSSRGGDLHGTQSSSFSIRCSAGGLGESPITAHPLEPENNRRVDCREAKMAGYLSLWELCPREVQSCSLPKNSGGAGVASPAP